MREMAWVWNCERAAREQETRGQQQEGKEHESEQDERMVQASHLTATSEEVSNQRARESARVREYEGKQDMPVLSERRKLGRVKRRYPPDHSPRGAL